MMAEKSSMDHKPPMGQLDNDQRECLEENTEWLLKVLPLQVCVDIAEKLKDDYHVFSKQDYEDVKNKTDSQKAVHCLLRLISNRTSKTFDKFMEILQKSKKHAVYVVLYRGLKMSLREIKRRSSNAAGVDKRQTAWGSSPQSKVQSVHVNQMDNGVDTEVNDLQLFDLDTHEKNVSERCKWCAESNKIRSENAKLQQENSTLKEQILTSQREADSRKRCKWCVGSDTIQSEKEKLQQENSTLKEEISTRKRETSGLNTKIRNLKQELDMKRKEVKDKEAEMKNQETKHKIALQSLKSDSEKNTSETVNALFKEQKKWKTAVSTLQQNLDTKQNEISGLQRQLEEMERDLADKDEAINALQTHTKHKEQTAIEDKKKLQHELENAHSDIKDLKDTVSYLQIELKNSNDRTQKLHDELQRAPKHEDVENLHEELRRERNERCTDMEQAQSERQKLKEDNKNMKERLDSLEVRFSQHLPQQTIKSSPQSFAGGSLAPQLSQKEPLQSQTAPRGRAPAHSSEKHRGRYSQPERPVTRDQGKINYKGRRLRTSESLEREVQHMPRPPIALSAVPPRDDSSQPTHHSSHKTEVAPGVSRQPLYNTSPQRKTEPRDYSPQRKHHTRKTDSPQPVYDSPQYTRPTPTPRKSIQNQRKQVSNSCGN